ncbi:hypothetical protein Bhyg_00660 [Pseudolycoriella hygida]|uniref:Uncharacterized protein n=1 Tax=Pseudolycoriella hygida TaxID=35572 RepID=A0A9Q0NA13_9DIPT|nr:hypothetical protein Bhyg_00660 [Pseudolycoriella hygida]
MNSLDQEDQEDHVVLESSDEYSGAMGELVNESVIEQNVEGENFSDQSESDIFVDSHENFDEQIDPANDSDIVFENVGPYKSKLRVKVPQSIKDIPKKNAKKSKSSLVSYAALNDSHHMFPYKRGKKKILTRRYTRLFLVLCYRRLGKDE